MINQIIPSRFQPIYHRLKRNPLVHRLAGDGYSILRDRMGRLWRWFYYTLRAIRNLTYCLLRYSDYRRWGNLYNYEEWWDSRTEQIARMIPQKSRVIEFGAGRRKLENFLDPSCGYVPSDLMDRGPGTFVCDLNRRPLPSLSNLNVDAAVFGGVLEYIHDMESLVEWLATQVSVCVASYAYTHNHKSTFGRLREGFSRFRLGYMNSYTEENLIDVFRRGGFRCIASDLWTSQRVFLFVNQRNMTEE